MRGPRARTRQALDEGIFGTRSGHTAVKLFRVHVRFINSVRRRSVGPAQKSLDMVSCLGAGRLDYLRLRQSIRRRAMMFIVAVLGLCMPEPVSRVIWLLRASLRPNGAGSFARETETGDGPQGCSSGLDECRRGSRARPHA